MVRAVDPGVVAGTVVSVLGHAAVIAALSLTHPGDGAPVIPASLVVLSVPGSPGPTAAPPARPSALAAARPALSAPAAPAQSARAPAQPLSVVAPEPVRPRVEPVVDEAPPPRADVAWPRASAPAPTAHGLALVPARGASDQASPVSEPASGGTRLAWPGTAGPSPSLPQLAALRTGSTGSSAEVAGSPAPSAAIVGSEAGAGHAHAAVPSGGAGGHRGPLSPPRLRADATPRYPEAARRSGIEGTALVRAQVLADGTVGTAEVRRSAGHDALDRAALDTIRRASFVPAERDGRPVTVWVEVPVQFRLDR